MIDVTTKSGNVVTLTKVEGSYSIDALLNSNGIKVQSVKLVDGAIKGFARVNGKHTEITAPLDDAGVAAAKALFADVKAAHKAAFDASYLGNYTRVVRAMNG